MYTSIFRWLLSNVYMYVGALKIMFKLMFYDCMTVYRLSIAVYAFLIDVQVVL